MSEQKDDSKPLFDLPPMRRPAPRKAPINIQDSLLFGSLKEGRTVAISLTNGKAIKGRIKRFDRYAVVVESDSLETLLYKHAIVGITEVPPGSGS